MGGLAILVLLSKGWFEDTSVLGQTDKTITASSTQATEPQSQAGGKMDNLFGSASDDEPSSTKTRPRVAREPFKYKAAQVIKRSDSNFDRKRVIPMGTNIIGQLLTSIDTRESEQFYKVFLPYGGKFKGGAEIPKGSTLFGKIRYSGKGNKVFMTFSKGIYPTGQEFPIQAQALNTKDYSPGINGDFHGQAGSRIAATLGLSMVSAGADVLIERESLGQNTGPGMGQGFGTVTPKSSLKNAMYAGVARGAEIEATRQAESLNEKEEFVTIDAGKDLIVNLTGEYKE